MIDPEAKIEGIRPDRAGKTPFHFAIVISWIKQHGLITLAILWVAISSSIRVYDRPMWYDEAVTMLTASGHAQTDFSLGMEQFKPQADLRKITFDLYNQDVHPPLYFWTLAIWRMAFGSSLEIARALSTLFVIGTCLLLYRLARDSMMRWPLIPVVVYGLGGAAVDYAWNARPYAMASFLILLTHLLAQKRSRWAGICGAASVTTHYFAALCVAPILVFAGIENWKSGRSWVKQTAATFAIGTAPLALLLRIHLKARPHQYPDFGPWHRDVLTLLRGSVADALPNSSLPGWGLMAVVVAAFALAGIAWAWKRRNFLVPFAYLGFLSGFLVLALITNKSIAKMPVYYYLGIAAPWLAMLVGFGLSGHPRWIPIFALIVVIGSATGASLVKSPNYRLLASKIKAECDDCAIVVGNGYAGAVPACVLYESGGMKVVAVNSSDTPQAIAERAGDQQPVIFVKTGEPPTAQAEDEFVRAYPSVWRGGYFEVFTGAPIPRTGSDEADRLGAPNPTRTSRLQ